MTKNFVKLYFATYPFLFLFSGWSVECLLQWKQFILLALPGALMILFDCTIGEVGIFIIGKTQYMHIFFSVSSFRRV